MALTIAIEGKGVIANCDAVTNDTGGTGTGDWSDQGQGTLSLSTDSFKYGVSSIGGQYASKAGLQQFDLGAGNELDFTASTGTEAGEFLYMWINVSALGTLDTLSTYPLCIRLSSDSPGTSNYIDYLIGGNDDTNGWDGGWKCFIIDPTLTPSRVSGTQSSIIASVRTVGLWIDTSTSARADAFFIDQIAVGSGLRIVGTSTTGWKDIVDYCVDYPNRAWGMFQEREGIYYSYGRTYVGDTTQSANVSFADSGRVIQFGISEYCTNAATGTWATSLPTDGYGIVVEDHASYTTTFTDGVLVGTDNGRSGSTIIGNADQDVFLDLYGGNNAGSVTALYGTTLKNLTGTLTWGNDSDHKFYGGSVIQCEQFDPVGGVIIRNCVFAETVSTEAALLWNSNISILDCAFIANTLGAAYEYPTQGTYGQTDLTYNGNTYDILYSAAASSGVLTINATDSNPSTYEITNPTGNSVSIINSVNLEVNGVKTDNEPTTYVRCRIELVSDGTPLLNKEAQTSYGVDGFYKAIEAYNYAGDVAVTVRARYAGYLPFETTGLVTSSGLIVTAVWIPDPNYN